MKKRILALLMTAVCGFSLAGCGGSAKNSGTAGGNAGRDVKTIKLLNGKAEIAEQLKTLAQAYEKETGVKVEVETPESGTDLQALLKAYYLADTMPDIFVCEGNSFENWAGLLADMSDQKWASNTDSAYVDDTYGTIGFPYATEAIGMTYNADILKKAGIDASKLTSPEAYQKAFETLNSKKSELGLTAVVGYCAEQKNLGWSTGNHLFGVYLDEGLKRDDTSIIDELNDGGKYDENRLKKYADFVGMLNKYSDPALLTKGTYEQQVRGFASGKYAFVTQGSWIGALMTGDYKDDYKKGGNFTVGMAPYAFEKGQDTILTSPPSWWAVLKEGNKDAAEAFLQWCSEDEAQKIFVEQAGLVSPFKDCKYVADDPFAQTMTDYIQAGKTSNWHWQNTKEGLGLNVVSPVYLEYAEGKLDANGFAKQMEKVTSDFYKVK